MSKDQRKTDLVQKGLELGGGGGGGAFKNCYCQRGVQFSFEGGIHHTFLKNPAPLDIINDRSLKLHRLYKQIEWAACGGTSGKITFTHSIIYPLERKNYEVKVVQSYRPC